MDLYWHWQMDVYPERATIYGEPGDYGRWTDGSEQAVADREHFETELLDVARQVKRQELSPERQLDYDLLVYSLDLNVAGFQISLEISRS